MNCTSCGASIENTSNKSSYQCEYCSSYNYDEKFIEERFANLNPTKANEIFGVAQVRFQSGRYDEAIDLLTESLKENNSANTNILKIQMKWIIIINNVMISIFITKIMKKKNNNL